MKLPAYDPEKVPIPPPCPDMRERQREYWTGEGPQTPAGVVGDAALFGTVLCLCAWGPVGWIMAGMLVGGRRR